MTVTKTLKTIINIQQTIYTKYYHVIFSKNHLHKTAILIFFFNLRVKFKILGPKNKINSRKYYNCYAIVYKLF